jgi:hypothetical protein
MESLNLPGIIDGAGLAVSIALMTRFVSWIIFLPSQELVYSFFFYYAFSTGLISDFMIICSFLHIGKPSELVLTVQMLMTAAQFYLYYDPGLILEYIVPGIIIITPVLLVLNPIYSSIAPLIYDLPFYQY